MLNTGTVLQGRYRVVASLGQGGMGAVYRVWDMRLNAPLALKELTPQPGLDAATLAQLRRQFEQEASVLANLSHPFLVDVTDYFEEGGNDYLVMKFVQGESLANCISREGALPEDRVLAWADQLLDALDFCHGQGVIHRDIKPQNVIIRADGHAVLVDFGLVKLWDPSDPYTRTAMRGMGTPEYAPPEQYSAQTGHTDPRSDIYGLGATLYHALTGQAPMEAGDRMAALSPFPGIRDLNPRVSAQTNAAVLRAMELPVPARFQSAAEMRAALHPDAGAQGGALAPVSAHAAAPAPRQVTKLMPGAPAAGTPWWKRIPTWCWLALGGIGFAAAVLLGAGFALGASGSGLAAVSPTQPAVTMATDRPPATTIPPASPTVTPAPGVPSLGDARARSTDGMVMVYVPAGEFQMGSAEGDDDEQPVHTVALDEFWIDQTEVTNGQYAQCVAAGTCEPPSMSGSYTRDAYYGASGYDDYPVIYVTWGDAEDYCAWAGARLLTEAEWEYAARGPEGYRYPWGDAWDSRRLNYCDVSCDLSHADESFDDGYADTAPVGSYPAGASWCGALDLVGNVWEWTGDRYGRYPSGHQENPIGPATGDFRVVRGGDWGDPPDFVHTAYRSGGRPDISNHNIGFRCAASPGAQAAMPTEASTAMPVSTYAPTPTPTRTPASTPPSLGDTRTRSADGMGMVYVPAGEFQMGSTEGDSETQPVHTVAFDGFWIDRTEVTNGQYAQCVAAGACNPPSQSGSWQRDEYYGSSAYDDYPVIYVYWRDADDYCAWAGARLPTEAEWEYAARGPEGHVYPWGDEWDGTRLNYCDVNCTVSGSDESFDDGHADTAPVGSYPAGASWCGSLDLAGNVDEWTVDWYGDHLSGGQEDPAGRAAGNYYLVRGGGWSSPRDYVHAAYRFDDFPDARDRDSGFRCVASAGE